MIILVVHLDFGYKRLPSTFKYLNNSALSMALQNSVYQFGKKKEKFYWSIDVRLQYGMRLS